jgi:triacylglycerol lipase
MSDDNRSDSRHLVDPDLLPLLDTLPLFDLSAETLAGFRTAMPAPPAGTGGDGVEETDRKILSHDGEEIALRIFRPTGQDVSGCLLHIHGGGFIAGSVVASAPKNRALVAALGCIVVAVEYRLAPEHRFPCALEDCYAALAWTIGAAAEFGVDPGRIGLKGESAGGGLAAALALLARDRGNYAIAFQHLTYPMLDDRTGGETPAGPFAGQYVWTPSHNRFGWSSLLGEPRPDMVPAYAAPARAADLSGLPPTFVMTGTLDLFFDENLDYVRRLVAAGVPAELHAFPGAFHGFELASGTAVARAATAASRAALARSLGLEAPASG